jgi:hypothetical protein
MRRARPYREENHGPGKDAQGELDLTPGIREQPGSDSVLPNHANLVHFTSDNRRGRRRFGPERREDQQLASRACDGDVKAAVAAFVVGRGYLGGDRPFLS